jgi:hypothetical protein
MTTTLFACIMVVLADTEMLPELYNGEKRISEDAPVPSPACTFSLKVSNRGVLVGHLNCVSDVRYDSSGGCLSESVGAMLSIWLVVKELLKPANACPAKSFTLPMGTLSS